MADPASREAPNLQIATTCGYFRTAFCPSDRRHYSVSVFWHHGVSFLIIIELPNYRVPGRWGGCDRLSTAPYLTLTGNFFLIKPTDALISQIYFCQGTLHISGCSSAHHQEFSTVHSALVSFMQVLMTASKQRRDVPFWLYLEAVIKNLYENKQCRM